MVLRLAALDVMSVCFFLTSYTVTGQKFLALHSSSFQATYCTYSMCVKAMMQSCSCLKLHVQFTPIQAVMCAHFQHKPVVLNVFPSTCFPLIHTCSVLLLWTSFLFSLENTSTYPHSFFTCSLLSLQIILSPANVIIH